MLRRKRGVNDVLIYQSVFHHKDTYADSGQRWQKASSALFLTAHFGWRGNCTSCPTPRGSGKKHCLRVANLFWF